MERISNQKPTRRYRLALTVTLACLIACSMGCLQVFASIGPNVTTHSQQEIRDYIEANGATINTPTVFDVKPVKNTQRGVISNESKNSALNMMNDLRYVAGVNPVTLNETQGNLAQAAAFVDYSIGTLTHDPAEEASKPADMSDTDWNDGIRGASYTNLAVGHSNLNSAVIDWTTDSDSYNINRVGHRRWLLNPRMSTTGFGAAGGYYAMYSMDSSNASGSQTRVAWPAMNMPTEYFSSEIPWSMSIGSSVNKANVNVTLTRTSDSKTWTFSGSETYQASDDKYFEVNNAPYGQTGCIIFRPDGIDRYKAGDVFHVKITGAASDDIEYDVHFFDAIGISGIQFSRSEYTVFVGNTSETALKPLPTNTRKTIDLSQVEYKVDDESVATVDASGTLTGVGAGTTTLTATYNGYTATTKVSVKKNIGSSSIRLRWKSPTYTGKPEVPEVLVTDGDYTLVEGTDYTLNKAMFGVTDVDGESHVFFIEGIGNYTNSKGASFTVQAKPITEDMVTLSADHYEYDGEGHAPTVTLTYNDMTLEEGKDYTIVNDQQTAIGSHDITITGKGNYKGTYTATYRIDPIQLQETDVAIDHNSFVYSGSKQVPTVTVTAKGKTLRANTDYEVTAPENSADVSSYKLTVKGVGNYAGTFDKTYEITPKALSDDMLQLSDTNLTYSGKAQGPTIIIKDGDALEADKDYTIQDATATDAGDYTAAITGKGNYKGELTVEYSIAPRDISDLAIDPIENQTYTGSAIEPKVVLGGLVEGRDFKVSYEQNVKVGQATVKVEGIGNCKGETRATFQICRSIKDFKASVSETPVYDSAIKEPKVEVKDAEGNELTEGSDYTVSYVDNINAGTAKAIVTGAGLYSESIEAEFRIEPADISSYKFAPISKQKYTGQPIEPAASVEGLNAETDYEITYENNIEKGTATVIANGKGNYTGSVSGSFEIVDVSVFVSEENQKKGAQNGVPSSMKTEKSLATAITKLKSDELGGSPYNMLQLRTTKQTKTSVSLSWKKVSGASKYVIYANKCGTGNKYKKLKTLTGTSLKVTKVAGSKLKKGTYYKFLIFAEDKYGNVLATSKTVHVATTGGKVTNAKSISIVSASKAKTALSKLKVGKSYTIRTKQVKASSKLKLKTHRVVKFESSNKAIATVSSKGTIKGKKKGTCTVYAYAQDGVKTSIKVTVK